MNDNTGGEQWHTTITEPFSFDSAEDKRSLQQVGEILFAEGQQRYERGLRGGNHDTRLNHAVHSRVTIPHMPNFHSTSRHRRDAGQDLDNATKSTPQMTLAQSDLILQRGLRDGTGSPTHQWKPKVTIPQEPNFHTSSRHHSHEKTSVSRDTSASLALSDDILRHGLRQMTISARSSRLTPTVPQEPRFHQSHPRELPLSAEEREAEMMEEIKRNRFKAFPIVNVSSDQSSTSSTSRQSRPITKPEPFHFHQSSPRHIEPSRDKQAEEDELELKNKFRARAMPQFDLPLSPSESHVSKPSRKSMESSCSSNSTDSKPFKARPVPKSTYEPTISPKPKLISPKATSPPTKEVQKMGQELEKERKKKLALIKPFQLASIERREAYLQKIEEEKRREEDEARRVAIFRARDYKPTPAPESTTKMQIQQMERDAQRKQKHEQEDEEIKRMAAFKARPLPKSIYGQSADT